MILDTDVDIDLVHQIGGDGFDSLKYDGVKELLADEPLTDNDVVSIVTDNEKNVDSSKQIDNIYNKDLTRVD